MQAFWVCRIIFFSMLVMSMGRLGSLETLVYFSMWMSLLGIFLFIFGTAVLRHITFPFAVLLFAIPLPAFLNNMVSFNLKLWSSALAEQVLKLLSVPVFREGNIIDLGVTQLQVVDACSWLRYLFPTMLMARQSRQCATKLPVPKNFLRHGREAFRLHTRPKYALLSCGILAGRRVLRTHGYEE